MHKSSWFYDLGDYDIILIFANVKSCLYVCLGKGVEQVSSDGEPRYRIKNIDTRQEYPFL